MMSRRQTKEGGRKEIERRRERQRKNKEGHQTVQ